MNEEEIRNFQFKTFEDLEEIIDKNKTNEFRINFFNDLKKLLINVVIMLKKEAHVWP